MVKIESPELSALVRRLESASNNAKRDLGRAVASQRRFVPVEASRAIRGIYTIKAERVKEGLTVGPVDQSDLSVTITGSKAGVGLLNFAGTRPLTSTRKGVKRARGVRVQILKARPAEILRSAFLPASKKIPFQRATPTTPRLPIEPIFGPSLADMLANPLVFGDLSRRFIARATAELNRLIRNALERRG